MNPDVAGPPAQEGLEEQGRVELGVRDDSQQQPRGAQGSQQRAASRAGKHGAHGSFPPCRDQANLLPRAPRDDPRPDPLDQDLRMRDAAGPQGRMFPADGQRKGSADLVRRTTQPMALDQGRGARSRRERSGTAAGKRDTAGCRTRRRAPRAEREAGPPRGAVPRVPWGRSRGARRAPRRPRRISARMGSMALPRLQDPEPFRRQELVEERLPVDALPDRPFDDRRVHFPQQPRAFLSAVARLDSQPVPFHETRSG